MSDTHIPGLDFPRIVREARPLLSAPYRLFTKTGIAPRLPRQVTIETTSACQLACPMCDRDGMVRTNALMSDSIFESVLEKIAPHPVRVNFNGIGEPLLDRKLPARIALAREAGIERLSLITNGLLLTEERAEALIHAGLDRIAISFDGADQASVEAVHEGSDVETLCRNLDALLALRDRLGLDRPKVVLRLTVMRGNAASIPDMFRRWHGRVDQVKVNLAYQYGGATADPVLPFDWDSKVPCPNMLDTLLVLTNGATTICCLGDINAELATGNLVFQSLEHCFSGPVAAEVRRRHRENEIASLPVCERCSACTTSNFRNAAISSGIAEACVSLVKDERLCVERSAAQTPAAAC